MPRLPENHSVLLAPDDRHAPLFTTGDVLFVDPTLKAPAHGEFFAIEYRRQNEAGTMYTVTSVQQCRRAVLSDECYVLGASSPERRGDCADGFYDADHFARAVLGRVVGVQRG
jgi:hypothetical protein